MIPIHNARITLLATALNNLAVAFVVAGFVAPVVTGQLQGDWQAVVTPGSDRHRDWSTFLRMMGARRLAVVTWDQALVWLIMPVIGAIIIGSGALWLARHTP
jgi:hypothetical protein